MADYPISLADILSNIEGKELQQQLKDNICALIQRDDVLVLQVNYEDYAADDDAPKYMKIKYLENTNWK